MSEPLNESEPTFGSARFAAEMTAALTDEDLIPYVDEHMDGADEAYALSVAPQHEEVVPLPLPAQTQDNEVDMGDDDSDDDEVTPEPPPPELVEEFKDKTLTHCTRTLSTEYTKMAGLDEKFNLAQPYVTLADMNSKVQGMPASAKKKEAQKVMNTAIVLFGEAKRDAGLRVLMAKLFGQLNDYRNVREERVKTAKRIRDISKIKDMKEIAIFRKTQMKKRAEMKAAASKKQKQSHEE